MVYSVHITGMTRLTLAPTLGYLLSFGRRIREFWKSLKKRVPFTTRGRVFLTRGL
jgi:hypothetical protein